MASAPPLSLEDAGVCLRPDSPRRGPLSPTTRSQTKGSSGISGTRDAAGNWVQTRRLCLSMLEQPGFRPVPARLVCTAGRHHPKARLTGRDAAETGDSSFTECQNSSLYSRMNQTKPTRHPKRDRRPRMWIPDRIAPRGGRRPPATVRPPHRPHIAETRPSATTTARPAPVWHTRPACV